MNHFMSNYELAAAIEAAWAIVHKTGAAQPTYQPAVDLFKALTAEQQKRAQATPPSANRGY